MWRSEGRRYCDGRRGSECRFARRWDPRVELAQIVACHLRRRRRRSVRAMNDCVLLGHKRTRRVPRRWYGGRGWLGQHRRLAVGWLACGLWSSACGWRAR
jgi:hypothetical protein